MVVVTYGIEMCPVFDHSKHDVHYRYLDEDDHCHDEDDHYCITRQEVKTVCDLLTLKFNFCYFNLF